VSDPLWRTSPETYRKCYRCDGTGRVKCPGLNCRNGMTWGRIYYGVYGTPIGRRIGWKKCTICHGDGTRWCHCLGGSVRRMWSRASRVNGRASRHLWRSPSGRDGSRLW